jgi:hypothetical protein
MDEENESAISDYIHRRCVLTIFVSEDALALIKAVHRAHHMRTGLDATLQENYTKHDNRQQCIHEPSNNRRNWTLFIANESFAESQLYQRDGSNR